MEKEKILPNDYINRKQCAEYLGVSIRTIDNLMRRRLLPFSRIGSRRLFILKQVKDFVMKNNTHSGVDYQVAEV